MLGWRSNYRIYEVIQMVSAVSRTDFYSLPQDIVSNITSELSKINPINFKENTGLAALYTSNRQISSYVSRALLHGELDHFAYWHSNSR